MDASTLILSIVAAAALAAAGLFWWRGRRTRRHQAARIAELERELEQAGEARETFFDLVTHELRSPLSAILGYQELLSDGAYGGLDDSADEPVERIGRSARHLLHLIDGVVELSRIRTGTLRPQRQPVNLGVLLASTAEAFRSVAHERHIDASVDMDDSLPTVHSDQDRLVRALDLLITSAVKHPAGSTVTLEIRGEEEGATVRVAGTEVETRAGAEDPALRLGIRLAVARGVAEALGGGLDLETDGDGLIRSMTFRITDLPESP